MFAMSDTVPVFCRFARNWTRND